MLISFGLRVAVMKNESGRIHRVQAKRILQRRKMQSANGTKQPRGKFGRIRKAQANMQHRMPLYHLPVSPLAHRERLFNSETKKLHGEINMEWGMKNRLSQLIQKDGKALFLPIDHGYFQGPTHCLEKPGETIKPIWQF